MKFDPNLKTLLCELKKAAKKKVKGGKQFTEFTGLIGELAVCELEDYNWDPQEGYDAKDKKGKKIQIKARRLQTSNDLKGGRMGRFGSAKKKADCDKYNFDRGILVVLKNSGEKNFEIAAIWERDVKDIIALEEEAKNGQKSEKLLGLHVRKFIEDKCHSHAIKNESHPHAIKNKCGRNFDCLKEKYGWK
tara:strand:+ start:656 stop:1225 length:570 start_codon:yes stop_codon:yes gene_type:complete